MAVRGGETVQLEVSQSIDRPVAEVFRFYAENHVLNHPRWDPDIDLWRESDEPIGVGTIIRRRNRRFGNVVEGTMEVVEYEPGRAFGLIIHEGPSTLSGRATFAADGPSRAILTVRAGFEGMDPEVGTTVIRPLMQRSVDNIKRMIESE